MLIILFDKTLTLFSKQPECRLMVLTLSLFEKLKRETYLGENQTLYTMQYPKYIYGFFPLKKVKI